MPRHNCINNSKFFASYINPPLPSDLPIPKFEEKIFMITDKQIKIETRNSPREKKVKKNRRRRKTIKKGKPTIV